MSGQNQTVRFGPFELDIQIGELRKNNTRLKLQGQPIQILEMLLAKPGELVTRGEIQQRLWSSDTFVDFDLSLNTAIKKLRQALGDEADAPCYVETLPKRGYRFICEVERMPAPPDDLVGPRELARTTEIHRTRIWVLIAVALLAIVSALIYLLLPTPPPRITGTHLLTRDAFVGLLPLPLRRPLTDGKSVYFQTIRSSTIITKRIPVTGGEASEIPAAPGLLADISRDGSALLFKEPVGPQGSQFNVWTQPLPTGSPRLIVRGISYSVIWALDGRGIFFTRKNDSELYRANADGTDERRLATAKYFFGLTLSPDGSRIRFGQPQDSTVNYRLWEIGVDGRNPHQILEREHVFPGTWSPDGKVYFFSAWDGDRYDLWAVRDGRSWWRSHTPVPERLMSGYTSYGPPTISRDGTELYAAAEEHRGELSIYDRTSDRFGPYLGGISACYVDFSPDGQWMAYVSYPEGSLWRSKTDGTQKMQLTLPPTGVMSPRWSPDGKMIVFTDVSHVGKSQVGETNSSRIYAVSADGGSPSLLLAGDLSDPTWSPDGNRIAYASGPQGDLSQVRIFNLQTRESTKVPASDGLWSPRWSPDGRYLVALVGDDTSKMALFTFATNTWQTLASGTAFAWDSWSHDSRFVYAQEGDSLIRIEVASHQRQQLAALHGLKVLAYSLDQFSQGWFGLSPDDKPITTRDTGIEGIYALDLEYK
jgi:Tol biopolymer transport system component/DNA-binding winged helix-turn-helix (wHTH) protein